MTARPVNRRDFVRTTAGTALALSLGCGDDSSGSSGGGGSTSAPGDSSGAPGTTSVDPDTSAGPGSSSSSTSGDTSGTTQGADSSDDGNTTSAATCEATDSDIEGPFYRPGIPIRDNLDIHGDAGIPLTLQGQVLDADCNPLVNAVVELWQASPRAPGSRPGDLDATYDASRDFRYYGQTASDRRGLYRFTTLVPGWYLNGAQYRPAHLHLKVWIRGQEALTTQLYFAGDPFNRMDPWFNPDNMLSPDRAGVAPYDLHVAP